MHNLILLISMPGGTEWLLILIVLPLYFLPTIIASTRHHPNAWGIFIVNLVLGWTFLGWVGSLVWAFYSGSKPSPTVIVNNSSQSYSQEYKSEKPDFQEQMQSQKQSITQQEKIDQLRQFKQLLDEGVITIEEFNKQKAAILSQ